MSRRQKTAEAQIVLFPTDEKLTPQGSRNGIAPRRRSHRLLHKSQDNLSVVLSGTYRKDLAGLAKSFEALKDAGLTVLSPENVKAVREENGFVFMSGEENIAPRALEDKHLSAIQSADFVWLHAPDGYIGTSASLEVGFSKAAGKRVFSLTKPADPILAEFIEVVKSVPDAIARAYTPGDLPRLPFLSTLQRYYRRVAIERGYERESAQDCLLLMVEEVGELARALRKSIGLPRDCPVAESSEALELADVTLYTVHMANILDIDLGEALRTKESINGERFYRRQGI